MRKKNNLIIVKSIKEFKKVYIIDKNLNIK